jgi:hypothetical protein
LVRGSDKDWRILRAGFSVRRDFSDEIEENVELYNWLNDPAQFENAEYPLLSHMFRVLKNLSIFALAQKQIYIFEKRDALAKFLPGVAIDDIDLLIKANVAFERNQSNANIAASKLAQRSIYDLFGRIDFELRKALLA